MNNLSINKERIDKITNKLQQALQPTSLEIIDDSHKHIGHAGAKGGAGHFQVLIASEQFNDKNTLACHRLIYQALSEMMPSEIHALSIQIKG